MLLYNKDKKGQLKHIKPTAFVLEKNIQKIFEDNLDEIMGLQFVDTEYVVKNKRFDTVAFDEKTKSFVIIEYKRDKSASVIDQGMTYLYLMLQNKSQFVLDYNNKFKKRFNINDIDWSQSRVVFVASSFNDFQQTSALFSDLAIELWTAKQFEDGRFLIGPLPKDDNITMPVPKTQKVKHTSIVAKVSAEIKPATESALLEGSDENIQELYELYKDEILLLANDIEVKPTKLYIGFKQYGKNKVDIEIHKKKIVLYVNVKSGQLDDPKNLFEDCSTIGTWGNGDYRITLTNDKIIKYILSVIQQAFK